MRGWAEVNVGGTFGRDPELKYTASGVAVVSFSLAVNRVWMKDEEKKEETSWIRCVAWKKAAETIAEYFKKGSRIKISGDLKTRSWETEDGSKRDVTEVTVRTFEFLDKSEGGKGEKREQPPGPEEADDIPF